jgi:hypothetical protein
MLSVITKMYNKQTKGPALTELFTVTGKLKKYFETRVVRYLTTGDMAHTIFKFLPYTRQHGCINILHCCKDQRGHVVGAVLVHSTTKFSFPVAMNNSIKVSALIFLLK